jgi:hypothetical protein
LESGELMARMRSAPNTDRTDRFDLARAFRYLGREKSYHRLDVVVKRLRAEGVKELPSDQELEQIAEANGSSAITALDLDVAFYHGVESLYAGPRHREVSE